LTLSILFCCANAGFSTSTLGTAATSVIGAKSLIGSNGSLPYSDWLMPWVPTVPISSV
jgi:hypothetical protein